MEDNDEDIPAYEQHILLMEEQIADPPAMQDVEQIMMEELEAYRERMTGDADPEDSFLDDNIDATPSFMTARQATTSLSDLEQFFIRHGIYENATWAAQPLYLQRVLQKIH